MAPGDNHARIWCTSWMSRRYTSLAKPGASNCVGTPRMLSGDASMASNLRTSPWLRSTIALGFGLLLLLAVPEVMRHFFDSFVNHGALHDREPHWGELLLYAMFVGLGGPAAALFAMGLDGISRDTNGQRIAPLGTRSTPQLLVASGVAMWGAWAIGHWVTHFAWFTDDEQAYLYQAKLYGRGLLSGPVLEPAALLRHPFVVPVLEQDGIPQWTGVYPVLQPFLMAVSAKLGFIHWSQLLCVGLIVFQTGRLAEALFGRASAGATAAWLCAFSPMLLGLGSTHHTSILATALSVSAVRVLYGVHCSGSFSSAVGLGLLTGSIFLARPMEGTLCVILFGGFLVARLWPAFRRHERRDVPGSMVTVVGYGLGGLVPLAVFLAVNTAHTGKPTYSAYNILEQQIGGFFGFGEGKMWGRTHTPGLALRQTLGALVRMNAWLFGWPASLALWFCSWRREYRNPKTLLLASMSVVQLCAYMPLAFGSVHDFGSAYHVWHLPWVACISAWVLHRMQEQANERWAGAWRGFPVRLGMIAMTLTGLVAFWPLQIQRWRIVSDVVLAPIRAAEAATQGAKAIVLWSQYLPPTHLRSWVHYPPTPDLDDRILWARFHPYFLPELRERYPDREFFGLNWDQTRPVITSIDASVEAFISSMQADLPVDGTPSASSVNPLPPPQ